MMNQEQTHKLDIGTELPKDITILVMTDRYWARGTSLADALANLAKWDHRTKLSRKAVTEDKNGCVQMLIYASTDPEIYVNNLGCICWDSGNLTISLGTGAERHASIKSFNKFAVGEEIR